MNIKKHIPNMLTAGNLLSGVMAIVFTLYAGRPISPCGSSSSRLSLTSSMGW